MPLCLKAHRVPVEEIDETPEEGLKIGMEAGAAEDMGDFAKGGFDRAVAQAVIVRDRKVGIGFCETEEFDVIVRCHDRFFSDPV